MNEPTKAAVFAVFEGRTLSAGEVFRAFDAWSQADRDGVMATIDELVDDGALLVTPIGDDAGMQIPAFTVAGDSA